MPNSDLDGNAAATRKVADQLFDAWSEKRDRDEGNKRRALAGSAPAWGGLLLAVLGIIWGAAVLSRDVNDHTRRIVEIENEQRTQATDNRQVIERMARIEAKLDIVLEGTRP